MKMNELGKDLAREAKKSAKSLWNLTPVLLGTILLISLVTTSVPRDFYARVFTGNVVWDPLIGAFIGGISAGNPLISYVIGGELLKEGIGLLAITAFIVAWVTVATIQFPAESMLIGKKFALWRNGMSFLFSILTAIITVFIVTTWGLM